ncbi:hypothetical protein EIP91_009103 [Steccherinum ochraceum]|uniref:DUF6534 domain-containing protein n=1 Tax=Steccherinum ochraceum TaxID=92696 RepID=A0A4R0RK40_9APHY|nr:hypothetical protein EIP91_009103 [Steccherinum ochraceum]
MPTNFVWLSFFWVMGKCYVNSFLASLNSREMLRSKVYASNALELSRSRRRGTHMFSPVTRKPSTALAVSIQTTTEYRTDFEGPESPSSANAYSAPQWSPSSSAVEVGTDDKLASGSTMV